MDVFELRERVIEDYKAFVTSFISIKDPRVQEVVDRELEEGLLAERLCDLAERLGVRAVSTANSLRLEDEFHDVAGAVLSLYPTKKLVHFILPRTNTPDQEAVLERLRVGLATMAGKPVATDQPSLQCDVALEQWDKFEPLVAAYVEGRQHAWHE